MNGKRPREFRGGKVRQSFAQVFVQVPWKRAQRGGVKGEGKREGGKGKRFFSLGGGEIVISGNVDTSNGV